MTANKLENLRYNKSTKRWEVSIYKNNRSIPLGSFKAREKAIYALANAENKYRDPYDLEGTKEHEDFLNRLKVFKEEHNLFSDELAVLIGVNLKKFAKYELGDISISRMEKIDKILDELDLERINEAVRKINFDIDWSDLSPSKKG